MIKSERLTQPARRTAAVVRCLPLVAVAGIGAAILLALSTSFGGFWLGVVGLAAIAFLNGANDLPKSVATLVGSGAVAPQRALLVGGLATLLGGILAVLWAGQLVKLFAAGGITAIDSAAQPLFPLAVIGGAVTWLLIATKSGLPVSTTHALVGASLGAALIIVGWGGVNWTPLALVVLAPLLGGPLLAGLVGYTATHLLKNTDISQRTRLCRNIHWFSAVAASLARAFNDAPKIVGVGLLALELGVSGDSTMPLVLLGLLAAAAMTAGGVWASNGVMHTLAYRVTDLGTQEGMTANLTNSALVGGASLLGLPLSTTHVSGAALVGASQAGGSRRVRWPVVREIALAWLVTIPGSALLAALFWLGGQGVIALV